MGDRTAGLGVTPLGVLSDQLAALRGEVEGLDSRDPSDAQRRLALGEYWIPQLRDVRDRLASSGGAFDALRVTLAKRHEALETERGEHGSVREAARARPQEQAAQLLDAVFLGQVRDPFVGEEIERVASLSRNLLHLLQQIESVRAVAGENLQALSEPVAGDPPAATVAEIVQRRVGISRETLLQALVMLDVTVLLDICFWYEMDESIVDEFVAGLEPTLRWETIEFLHHITADQAGALEEFEALLGPYWEPFAGASPVDKMTMLASLIAGARGMGGGSRVMGGFYDHGASSGSHVIRAVRDGGEAFARATRGRRRRNPGFRAAAETFGEILGEAGEQAARRAGVSREVLDRVRDKVTVRQLQTIHARGPTAVRTVLRLYYALGSIEHFKVLEVLIGRRFVVPYLIWRAGIVVQVVRLVKKRFPGVSIKVTGSVGVKGQLKRRTPAARKKELETAKDLDITITGAGRVGQAQLCLESMLRALFGASWIMDLDMTLFGDPSMAMEGPLSRFLVRGLGRSRAARQLRRQIRRWVDEALEEYDELARQEALVRNRDILIAGWGAARTRSWFDVRGWTWPEDESGEAKKALAPLDPTLREQLLLEFDALRLRLTERGGQLIELAPGSDPYGEAEAGYRNDLGRFSVVYHRLMAGTPGAYVLRGTRKMWVLDREALLPSASTPTPAAHRDNVIEHFGIGWHYTTPGHADVIKAAKYWPRLLKSGGDAAIPLPSGKGIAELLGVASGIKAAKDTAAADKSLASFYDRSPEAATSAFVEDLQHAGEVTAEHLFPARAP